MQNTGELGFSMGRNETACLLCVELASFLVDNIRMHARQDSRTPSMCGMCERGSKVMVSDPGRATSPVNMPAGRSEDCVARGLTAF